MNEYISILKKAQKNAQEATTKEVPCYKTSFSPPKPPPKRPSKVSSENIRKFLEKKDHEAKLKEIEARRQKMELLALRSQDKKAQRRVQVMLKRTKSANKSVMADAIDNENTADTLTGPQQCDEDDYGFVSANASALHQKLLAKYEQIPNKSLFSEGKKEVKDLQSTKDRVRAAIKKETEEGGVKKKRRSTDEKEKGPEGETEKKSISSSSEAKDDKKSDKNKKPDVPKKKIVQKAPPPPDFLQLLKIAEQVQHKPVVLDKKEESTESRRPMTNKEKSEYEKEKARRAKALADQGHSQAEIERILRTEKLYIPIKKKSKEFIKEPVKKPVDTPAPPTPQPSSSSLPAKRPKLPEPSKKVSPRPEVPNKIPKLTKPEATKAPVPSSSTLPKKIPSTSKTEQNKPVKNSTLSKINEEIEKLLKEKEELLKRKKANGINQKARESLGLKPGPADDPKMAKKAPLPSPRPVKKVNKRVIASDSEYDSELDDFIDDGEEELDYSSHIREIFGYDRSRYRDEDFDDSCMESSYAQQMREERISARIGLEEDLRDMEMERQEKEQKAKMRALKMKQLKKIKK